MSKLRNRSAGSSAHSLRTETLINPGADLMSTKAFAERIS